MSMSTYIIICHLTKDQSSLRVHQDQDSELRNDSSKLSSLKVCGCGTPTVIQPVTLIQDEEIHMDKHFRRLLWLVYTTQTTRKLVTKDVSASNKTRSSEAVNRRQKVIMCRMPPIWSLTWAVHCDHLLPNLYDLKQFWINIKKRNTLHFRLIHWHYQKACPIW